MWVFLSLSERKGSSQPALKLALSVRVSGTMSVITFKQFMYYGLTPFVRYFGRLSAEGALEDAIFSFSHLSLQTVGTRVIVSCYASSE